MNIKFTTVNHPAEDELIVNITVLVDNNIVQTRCIDVSEHVSNILIDLDDVTFEKPGILAVEFSTVDENIKSHALFLNNIVLDDFYANKHITFAGTNVETNEPACNVLSHVGTLRYEFKYPFLRNIFG